MLFLKLLLPLLRFNNLSSFYNRIMIRQDYFLRLLEEFATALATMMKKKEELSATRIVAIMLATIG